MTGIVTVALVVALLIASIRVPVIGAIASAGLIAFGVYIRIDLARDTSGGGEPHLEALAEEFGRPMSVLALVLGTSGLVAFVYLAHRRSRAARAREA
ncbi:MAG: hypothetical protein K8W52_13280 [Deltaproteobacteria bacterium]|nr:hypothetical protein [Deltaproteobacteria bacterium]